MKCVLFPFCLPPALASIACAEPSEAPCRPDDVAVTALQSAPPDVGNSSRTIPGAVTFNVKRALPRQAACRVPYRADATTMRSPQAVPYGSGPYPGQQYSPGVKYAFGGSTCAQH